MPIHPSTRKTGGEDTSAPEVSASGRFDVFAPVTWGHPQQGNSNRPPYEPDPDPLSKALHAMRIDSFVTPVHTFGSPWGVLLPGVGSGAVHTVLSGACEVRIEEGVWAGHTVRLGAGDILILTRGLPHSMRDQLCTPAKPIHQVIPQGIQKGDGQMIRAGGGGAQTEVVFGAFTFSAGQVPVFWSALPGMLVHRAGAVGSAASWATQLSRACRTLRQGVAYSSQSICGQGWDKPGFSAIANQWVQLVIASAVQQSLVHSSDEDLKWLRADEDPDIARSIQLILQQPHQQWTVASLAEAVGMSRSVFAERFAALVGQTPMVFLLRYRMEEACRLLLETTLGLKQIAVRLGYASQPSFSVAFRREVGVSPGKYRHAHTQTASNIEEKQDSDARA